VRRVVAITVALVALAAAPAEAQAGPRCKSGDPLVSDLVSWPVGCSGARKVVKRWLKLERCSLGDSCSFRLYHRWHCRTWLKEAYEASGGSPACSSSTARRHRRLEALRLQASAIRR
jgi:hypothetical protein